MLSNTLVQTMFNNEEVFLAYRVETLPVGLIADEDKHTAVSLEASRSDAPYGNIYTKACNAPCSGHIFPIGEEM